LVWRVKRERRKERRVSYSDINLFELAFFRQSSIQRLSKIRESLRAGRRGRRSERSGEGESGVGKVPPPVRFREQKLTKNIDSERNRLHKFPDGHKKYIGSCCQSPTKKIKLKLKLTFAVRGKFLHLFPSPSLISVFPAWLLRH
jgi:hypothetical protein